MSGIPIRSTPGAAAAATGVPTVAGLSDMLSMEVESTHVQVLPNGKKMIDVRMQRTSASIADKQQSRLVVPQFDSNSSSSDEEENDRIDTPPVFPPSPQKKVVSITREEEEESNNHPLDHRSPPWSDEADDTPLSNPNKLMEQLVAYKHQVKSLEIQLEALTPLPGLPSNVVQEILLNKNGIEHDLRDSKIVHQAKTLRHFKRSLQREKQSASDAFKQTKQLILEKNALEQENETLQLKLARFQARASAVAIHTTPGNEPENETIPSTVSKESLSYRKKYEDLKIKHDKLAADLKKTQRVLLREVGEEVNVEELVESAGNNNNEGKRLRAQQIIMLKAKVKKLEQEIAKGSHGNSIESNSVDQRVQNELANQQEQRQRVIDRLSTERDELLDQMQQMTKKCEALKSRTQILEKEKQENKGKITVLVDKSRNDDALIDVLQKQMEMWKSKVNEVKRARTADGNSSGGSGLMKDERMELDRLRAMVAEYKRNPSQSAAMTSNMSGVSEAAQYRALATEKERLAELVKSLQVQVEEKDRQLKIAKTILPPAEPPASRIPRLGQGSKSNTQYIPTPPQLTVNNGSNAEITAIRKTFRESMAAKDQEIETLQQQIRNTQATSTTSPYSLDEIQDLQEENTYLRQEFDKLKTRYEVLIKQQRIKTS